MHGPDATQAPFWQVWPAPQHVEPHTGPALQVTQALFWQTWLDDWQQLAPQAKVPAPHWLTQAPLWQTCPAPQHVEPHTGPALQVTQALFWQIWLDDWQQLAPHANVPAPQALTQAPFWQVWVEF